MAGESTERILLNIDTAWRPFREAVESLGDELDRKTSSGWPAKEMLGHVAFWDEAVVGVVIGMFRQSPMPAGWDFGSGYAPAQGEWPAAAIHNAREAEWARGQSGAIVLERLWAAHEQMVSVVASVTDAEAADHADYFAQLGTHYTEHLAELMAGDDRQP